MSGEQVDWEGDRWEYWSGFMFANLYHAELYGARWEGAWASRGSGVRGGGLDFVPEALIPVLNERGAQGWELVSVQSVPAEAMSGLHQPPPPPSVSATVSSRDAWTHAYLCIMKRRLPR